MSETKTCASTSAKTAQKDWGGPLLLEHKRHWTLLRFLIAGVVAHVPLHGLAQTPNPAQCTQPSAESPASLEWLRMIDRLGDHALRQPEPGDHPIPSGAIIGAECISGPNSARREAILARFDRVLNRAFQQAQRCQQVLNLPNVDSIISILRRTRFLCPPNLPSSVTGMNSMDRFDPSVAPFGTVNRSYDRTYLIRLSISSLMERNEEDVASTLFHEALHSTSSNHRVWHNNALSNHQEVGCQNSIFLDRIYLMQAACFPSSSRGVMSFYSSRGAWQCPGVCERAFTEVDADVGMERAPDVLTPGIIGPPLIATPRSNRETTLICDRIRSTRRLYNQIREEIYSISHRFGDARSSRFYPGRETPAGAQLQETFGRIYARAQMAFQTNINFTPLLDSLNSERQSLQSQISRGCAQTPLPRDWTPLCEVQGTPLLSAADQFIEAVRSVQRRHEQAIRNNTSTPSQILSFFSAERPN
jgi:hypothetical protein